MDVKRATIRDWESVRDVRLRSLSDAPNAFCSTFERESQFDDDVWRDRLSVAATFLAWEHDAPVGTVTGKPDPNEEGGYEIAAMWVEPSARHTGVAADLIRAVIDWTRTKGTRSIALWVAEDNVPARRLYEKCGFSLTGERDVMRPGVDQMRMRRLLDE